MLKLGGGLRVALSRYQNPLLNQYVIHLLLSRQFRHALMYQFCTNDLGYALFQSPTLLILWDGACSRSAPARGGLLGECGEPLDTEAGGVDAAGSTRRLTINSPIALANFAPWPVQGEATIIRGSPDNLSIMNSPPPSKSGRAATTSSFGQCFHSQKAQAAVRGWESTSGIQGT
jgi:hypothetical protein